MSTWRWIISHKCCWITVYVFCRNAQIKYHSNHHAMYLHCHVLTICQLPSCNLFTQHVSYLYGETPLVNCGPRSNSFTLIKPQIATCSFFIRCNLILIFHTRRLILCFQQAGEIDNLTVTLGQSTLIVLCAGPRWWSSNGAANNLLKNRYSYWFDKPWFHTEGKLAARLHQTFLLGSPNEQVRLASLRRHIYVLVLTLVS